MAQTTRPTRRPRAGLLALAVAAVLAAVVVAISYWRFWAPATDAPQSADAIVILGGEAEESTFPSTLAAQGWAPNLVMSLPNPAQVCPPSTGSLNVICFKPDPKSTRGEARAIGALARQHGWKRLIIVSGRAQTSRARLRVARCWNGELLMVPAPAPSSVGKRLFTVAYEWGATAKALLWQRSC
ncbi:hypothetical protein K6U06_13215 [Acidiferrimicrobium sp. IK]|uniref:YdcF family protein n=1 Tax=Acidiferrimicrobium sp. IK TaxID=2871700 RepID=UPI0021CB0C91|nr:hypothetical protein [Acidiferrimicrobium sp. IK]MCU4185327.1 hypothetical protein [Acidiferrimicrobium sp. IK]